jgi:uncharacterized protein (DUF1800 family)
MMLEQEDWAPYEPSAADPWDLRKVAHLHRRAGFGATWAELHRDVEAGVTASVDRLLKPPAAPEAAVAAALRDGVLASNDAERLKAWWLYRILYDPDPLREKLTLYWHSHFATSLRKVGDIGMMVGQNELLRRHALDSFGPLVMGVISDPAMLVWLDGADSRKEKPNENFAREFLELFTLGVGQYSEQDIREAARAFTGWVRAGDDRAAMAGPFQYDPSQFDDGVKTFLKKTGSWKPQDIVDITLDQPCAAEFLCRKLYRFFVSENGEPPAEPVRLLARDFRSHAYSIRHIVGVILRSRHFYSRAVYRQRIKGPVEFSAGLLRTLEAPPGPNTALALAVACERQGQDLFHPPNVKGWDGGRTWLNSTTLLERGNWAADVVWGSKDFGLKPFDPLQWGQRNGLEPKRVVEGLLDLLLHGDESPRARETIIRTAADGKPDSIRKALQMILHCPEVQLA